MRSYSYYNGTFAPTNEIRIPLTDRAIYFGDGVYDAAIGKDGRIFLADEHIKRFISNAKKISIPKIPSYQIVLDLLTETIKRAEIDEFFIYFQISANAPHRTHSSLGLDSSNLLITVSETETVESCECISLITEEDIRHLRCDIKTINLLPAVIASTRAAAAGCDEAVFHRGCTVTECSHSNISILKNGTLYTHPLNNLILPGITRARLLLTCHKLGIPYRERAFTLDELYCADEILVTSTSKLCRRAGSINGVPCGAKDPTLAKKICHNLYLEYSDFCNCYQN